MTSFLVACASSATSTGGCYDWPVIKQIIQGMGYIITYLYQFLDLIGLANFGVCIILFTIIVKCVLLPLTVKQQKFTKLQSYAQPEIKAIQEKYQGKRDNYSMQAMQDETKAVYAKYGISQTGGCLQTLIQMPIMIALYGAIRNIPLYVEEIRGYYETIINTIHNTDIASTVSQLSSWTADLTVDDKITILSSLPTKGWNTMMEIFDGSELDIIQQNYNNILQHESFLGINLGDTPWNQIVAGGIGIIAILIPLVAGFSQWLSFKLTQSASTANNGNDPTAATAKSMGLMMPLMSVFFCFTLNASIGLYWCISSLFQVVLQIIINKHYRKIDMDEFVKQNMQKAEEKAKKKREKAGVSGESLSKAANTNAKNIQSQAPKSISDIAKMNVNGSSDSSKKEPPAGSLAAKAAMVQKFNEENNVDINSETGNARKKYKK